MFVYERGGVHLLSPRLALDSPTRQSLGFVSHAHADHMAPHELAILTAETGRLYRLRHGAGRRTKEVVWREPWELGSARFTVWPAGHMPGSAMLRVQAERASLLYTGDFQLEPSRLAEQAELPTADLLIMECTFGLPRFRRPARGACEQRLLEVVEAALQCGLVPVVYAYRLGKAQEVACVLAELGPVWLHPEVFAVAGCYQEAGRELGQIHCYDQEAGRVLAEAPAPLVMPPPWHQTRRVPLPPRRRTIGVSGWAQCPQASRRWGCDLMVALSDHADYDQLLECVQRVEPKVVYCHHGQPEFVDDLRRRGWDAHWLPDGRVAPP